jgi:hypothetical protein
MEAVALILPEDLAKSKISVGQIKMLIKDLLSRRPFHKSNFKRFKAKLNLSHLFAPVKSAPPLCINCIHTHKATITKRRTVLKLLTWYVPSEEEIYRYAQYITETQDDVARTLFLFV